MEDEVVAEKTNRQVVEDEVAAEKTKRQALDSALRCLIQGQGGELPPNVAVGMNSLEGQNAK
ncbi:hypothetical protein Ahy_A10g049455 isoform E [Arachis hypogaea]|uniref:Uncharacterized protein n=1 Tax=Arachis hypogaea TaxID=3818 RepID=A0A445B770_ARAHY|nr:hypothetical protein Ahy_A10g049455 isoform E [Arachis hypogaea]